MFSIITVVLSIVIVIKKFSSSLIPDIKYISLTALLLWMMGDISISVEIPYEDTFNIILQSLALSLLLIIFLIFIRRRKPAIFRYPYYVVFIPLLIPVAQFVIVEAVVMRKIIFMSVQGVAIIVFILLAFAYAKELDNKVLATVGAILLVWGFAFFWILQNNYIVFEWAWALTNSLGFIACIYSFSDLLKLKENL